MHVDKEKLDTYSDMIVYKSYNPKKLYRIESVAKENPFDVTFYIKDEEGIVEKFSSLGLKSIDSLIEDTETKLKNHKARLWNFEQKMKKLNASE